MNFEDLMRSSERITGVIECNDKLMIFTPDKVYTMRKMRWYERLWKWLTR